MDIEQRDYKVGVRRVDLLVKEISDPYTLRRAEKAHGSHNARSHCDIFSQGGKVDSKVRSSTTFY